MGTSQSLPFVMLTHLLVSLILLFLATTRVDNPLLLSSGSLLEKPFILEVIEFREDLSGISWSIFSCSEKSLTRRSQWMMMMKMKKKPPKKHQRRLFRTSELAKLVKTKMMKKRKRLPGSQKVLLTPPAIRSESDYRGPPP